MAGVNLNRSPLLHKESVHMVFRGEEFWAEDGCIFIENRSTGDCKTILPRDFALRAAALNAEAKRCFWQDQRDSLNDAVIKMREVYFAAKEQGDCGDAEVVRRKVRERRRATIITGTSSGSLWQ
jgi:hypothetical protein